jgi:CRISPR-associated protein Cas2
MVKSGYRAMWIFTMFDLPTDTAKARKAYTLFRKNLLKDGFTMLQYSIYVRHCSSEENMSVHAERVRRFLPPDGEVNILKITDKQFERMEVYWGKMRKTTPDPPDEIGLF